MRPIPYLLRTFLWDRLPLDTSSGHACNIGGQTFGKGCLYTCDPTHIYTSWFQPPFSPYCITAVGKGWVPLPSHSSFLYILILHGTGTPIPSGTVFRLLPAPDGVHYPLLVYYPATYPPMQLPCLWVQPSTYPRLPVPLLPAWLDLCVLTSAFPRKTGGTPTPPQQFIAVVYARDGTGKIPTCLWMVALDLDSTAAVGHCSVLGFATWT